jgi:hypothetical protein
LSGVTGGNVRLLPLLPASRWYIGQSAGSSAAAVVGTGVAAGVGDAVMFGVGGAAEVGASLAARTLEVGPPEGDGEAKDDPQAWTMRAATTDRSAILLTIIG